MMSDGEKECVEKELNVRMSITKKETKGSKGSGDKENWGKEMAKERGNKKRKKEIYSL